MTIKYIIKIFVILVAVLFKNAAFAGQISVINPAAGSSITGVAVPSSPTVTLGSPISQMGILPAFKGKRDAQKPSLLISASRGLLLQSIKTIDTSKFTTEQKKKIIGMINKRLVRFDLDQVTKDFLNAELKRLSANLQ